jgi:hypothetical protein
MVISLFKGWSNKIFLLLFYSFLYTTTVSLGMEVMVTFFNHITMSLVIKMMVAFLKVLSSCCFRDTVRLACRGPHQSRGGVQTYSNEIKHAIRKFEILFKKRLNECQANPTFLD